MDADIPRSKRRGVGHPATGRESVHAVFAELFLPPLDPHASKPLYEQISNRLRDAIGAYKLLPGSRLPSESELCKMLGVSRNTVMRAINDLRDEGLLYRERGSGTYVRHAPKHPMDLQPTLHFGIVSPTSRLTMTDLYLSGILDGLSHSLNEVGAVAVLGSPSINPSSNFFREITRRDIDGFIVIAPSQHDLGAVSVLAKNGVPFVVIGADFTPEWDAVTSDNRLGIRLAFDHLRSLGHTRIGFICAPDHDFDSGERWKGLEEAWRDAEPADGRLLTLRLTTIDRWEEEITRTLAIWLEAPNPPTAIVGAGLPMTLISLRTLHTLGVSVPKEISIVGYDDYTMMEYLAPPLTTIRQPLAAMGATAARLLAAKVRGEAPVPVHHMLPVELVVRGSTAPPRA